MYKFYLKENISSNDILKYALNDNGIFNYSIFYNEYGKPYIDKKIYFNISHCNNIVVCVISDEIVGVDIEKLNYKKSVVKRCFNEKEINLINNSINKKEIFTIIWTCKESYVKKIGIGLEYGLKKVDTFKYKYDIKKFNDYIVTICLEDSI